MENEDITEAKEIYLSHIKAFNNFYEPDGRKNSANDFVEKFNSLIFFLQRGMLYEHVQKIKK